MTHDLGDLCVVLHLGQDPLADLGVLLHLPPLTERERARLLEESGRQPDLADVVHEPTLVRQLLLLLRQPEPLRDVPRVDRDGSRVAGRVPIPSIERCDKRSREGQVGPLQPDVREARSVASRR